MAVKIEIPVDNSRPDGKPGVFCVPLDVPGERGVFSVFRRDPNTRPALDAVFSVHLKVPRFFALRF